MTKNKTAQKWKSIFKWLGWIVSLAAKVLPSNLKMWAIAFSTLAGGLVTLLDKCDHNESPPAPAPLPTETKTPTPTPQPTPTPPPPPELKAPQRVKAGEPFVVELCNTGNLSNVHLFADVYRLGFMGFGKPCMRLTVTLNTSGNRRLSARRGDLLVETDVIVD